MSSKYDLEYVRFLTHLQSYHRAEIWHTSKILHNFMLIIIADILVYTLQTSEIQKLTG